MNCHIVFKHSCYGIVWKFSCLVKITGAYYWKIIFVNFPRYTAIVGSNECSLFVASLTVNECIWPYSNRTWHEPMARSLTDMENDRGTRFSLWRLLLLLLVSLVPRISLSDSSLSLQQSKSVTLAKISLEALLHKCQQATTTAATVNRWGMHCFLRLLWTINY